MKKKYTSFENNDEITSYRARERKKNEDEGRKEDEKGGKRWTRTEAVSLCSLVTVSSLWMGSLSRFYEKSYYLHYRWPPYPFFLPSCSSLRDRVSFFGGSRRAITVRMEDGRESIFLTVLVDEPPGLLSRERIREADADIARAKNQAGPESESRSERLESKYVRVINSITKE